jgi:serine/threonine-protein kinase
MKHMVTGQTSQVWEVVELASHRHFAMKLLLPRRPPTRFTAAPRGGGGRAVHPNIIRIVTTPSKTTPYFVMEFFPAGSLKVHAAQETDFIRERRADILKQWATGMAF